MEGKSTEKLQEKQVNNTKTKRNQMKKKRDIQLTGAGKLFGTAREGKGEGGKKNGEDQIIGGGLRGLSGRTSSPFTGER